ncbi:MAG: hypothetical protein ACRC9L_06720 [Brevinema sp.]
MFILIRQILQKVVVSNKGLEFTIDQDNLKAIAEIIFRGYDLPEELGKSGNTLSYTKICKIEQVRHGKGFIIEGQHQRSESLVNALKQAWEWNDWIAEGKYKLSRDIAKDLGYNTPRRVENVMRLRYLSPKIQLMILKGIQPRHWTTRHLFTYKSMNWAEQEKELSL